MSDGETLVDLQADECNQATASGHELTLDPYGYQWYRVDNLKYILARQRG